jgi:nucleoside-diphosphate-sugar epimerase
MKQCICVAGATGNLGLKIVRNLVKHGVEVRALVRINSDSSKIEELKQLGATIFEIKKWEIEDLKKACLGATCVVSALAGLRDVVIDKQKVLVDAALLAKVPRFIPSDYCLDFTHFSKGENRNLDWRREFHEYLDTIPIASTSIFNGAFMDLILNEMPFILFKQKMILYWGNVDYKWGFTTIDDTAAYTALVAIDDSSPRYLRIAGDQISPRDTKSLMIHLTGEKYRFFRPGGKGLLGLIIKIARKMSASENELYPAWQGMQYMHNMIDERSKIEQNDSNRYAEMQWTDVSTFLIKHIETMKKN